jgi:hypothetical protein
MVRFKSLFALILLACLAETAVGHEGHGDPSHATGVLHYLTSASHVVQILCFVSLALCGLMAFRMVRRFWSR